MIDQLESNYNCANASGDLQQLKQELKELIAHNDGNTSKEFTEKRNRLENQIRFIHNKCDIH